MELLRDVFEWFRDPDNRGAVQVLVAVAVAVVAWATGLLRWLFGLVRPKKTEAPREPTTRQRASGGSVNVGGNARDVTTHARREDDPA